MAKFGHILTDICGLEKAKSEALKKKSVKHAL